MNTARKREILLKAKEINDSSEQYQLIHATYAIQKNIENIVNEFYQHRLNELKKRIAEKLEKDIDIKEEQEEIQELKNMIGKKLFSIHIDYINISNDDIARVVKVGNTFTIYLAASLRDSIYTEDKDYNYKAIAKIRKLMSHELGHLVLHTKNLLLEEGLQGSLTIDDEDKEEEATLFGQELLYLRKERNKKIRKDGGAENLF